MQLEISLALQTFPESVSNLTVVGFLEAPQVNQLAISIAAGTSIEKFIIGSAAFDGGKDATPAPGTEQKAVIASGTALSGAGSRLAVEAVLGGPTKEQDHEQEYLFLHVMVC